MPADEFYLDGLQASNICTDGHYARADAQAQVRSNDLRYMHRHVPVLPLRCLARVTPGRHHPHGDYRLAISQRACLRHMVALVAVPTQVRLGIHADVRPHSGVPLVPCQV